MRIVSLFRALMLCACIFLVSCDFIGQSGSNEGNKPPQNVQSQQDQNVNVSVEQKAPKFEYVGNVQGTDKYGFKETLRIERKGDDYTAILDNERAHVSIGYYDLEIRDNYLEFNASASFSDGPLSKTYYFNL